MSSRSYDASGLALEILGSVKGLVEEAAVKVSYSRSGMIKTARGSVIASQVFEDISIDIYLARDKKILVTSFRVKSPHEALSRLPELVASLEPSPFYAELPEPVGTWESVADERIIESLDKGDLKALAFVMDPDRWGDISGMAEMGYRDSVLAFSTGKILESRVTWFTGYARIFSREKLSGQWSWASTGLDEKLAISSIGIARDLAEKCASLPEAEPPQGSLRILLSPMIASNLIDIVASSTLAGSVILGFSMFSDAKPGDMVAGEALTLSSIPLDRELPGFATADDEGVPTRNLNVIENGVLKTFLHNTKTARLMGAESTGNAGWLLPRLFNIEVKPGDINEEELYEALGEGAYLTNNWYTRLQNYLEGRFSTVLRDAVIIVGGGRPKGCVPGYKLRLQGSLKDMIRRIEGLGSRVHNIMWWEVTTPTKSPHILIGESDSLVLRRA